VWGVQSMYGSGDESSADGSPAPRSAGQAASPKNTPKTGSNTVSTMSWREGCRDLLESQAQLLRTGARPLAQWKVHIGAMNQLVNGAISVEQAREFWDETRLGAHRNLARYESARQPIKPAARGCGVRAGHGAQGAHGAEARALRNCRASITARSRAVQALDTTLATWREHVHHMEMLRMGHMSAERAGQLWLASWETGNQQVRDYHAALHASRNAHC
jgi:hypothetical protein